MGIKKQVSLSIIQVYRLTRRRDFSSVLICEDLELVESVVCVHLL